MIDKFVDTLVASGPLGILCAILIAAFSVAAKTIAVLFKLYQDAQEKRIAEALKAQEITQQQIAIIQGIKELLQQRR
jgi:histidinol-phosphate/aromatic aminotransferase/cobyric acid decarboxylase-like protein